MRKQDIITALVTFAVLFAFFVLWQTTSQPAPQEPLRVTFQPQEPEPEPQPERAPVRPAPRPAAPPTIAWVPPGPAPSTPVAKPEPAPIEEREPCQPRAGEACHEGDVWWLDSCGKPESRVTECGNVLCANAACPQPPEDACGDETGSGRCDGDHVVTCHGGRVHEIDCAEAGETCRFGEQGAVCAPAPEFPCSSEPPRCDGDTLVVCSDGGLTHVDCAALDAECDSKRGRCLQVEMLAEAPDREDDCEPCGCRELITPTEVKTVDVVAFVVADTFGRTSHGKDDITRELTRVNALYQSSSVDSGLHFELVDSVIIQNRDWIEADEHDMREMITSPQLHPVRERFYIPIVFTDVATTGRVPKYGSATMPNFPHPPVGIILVSKDRHATTVGHEIGHFLGLHHTHRATPQAVARQVVWPGGGADCDACHLTGDEMCETPVDPGLAVCTYVPGECTPLCSDGSAPKVSNLMSYYHYCRRAFTADQVSRMRVQLAHRERIHAILLARSRTARSSSPSQGF